ncbi:MAG: hypothetical protein Q8939_04935 [Bacteroidota bacterium]|nr:hypothetical protein [Bacteroidota bacterium]
MKERKVPCALCNSNDYNVLFPAGKAQVHRIVQCNHCNLIYANPQTDNVGDVEKKYLLTNSDDSGSNSLTSRDRQYLQKQFLQLKGIFIFLRRKRSRSWLRIMGSGC